MAEMKVGDSLGDRMKSNYENRYRFYLTRRTPVIIRVDGKAFHTLMRGRPKPFDEDFINAMLVATDEVLSRIQGFKLAYVQSDEASFLLTDYDQITTEAWFDYNKSKMESIAASFMSVYFNLAFPKLTTAVFDARAFNIPETEIANYFLWRAKDWERNSLTMYCQAHFSHNELHGKRKQEQHDMLHSIGKNWATDLMPHLRNGVYLLKNTQRVDIKPSYDQVSTIVTEALSNPDAAQPTEQDEELEVS